MSTPSCFTCEACGGFQYEKLKYLLRNPDLIVCKECYDNNPVSQLFKTNWGTFTKKPGLHEVLASIHDAHAGTSIDLSDWLYKVTATTDEEKAAEWIQRYYCDIWKEHYQKITGEPRQ